MPIQEQKQFNRDKRSALVAVDKRMIAGETVTVRCRAGCNIGCAIGRKVLRPRQRRFEQALIAQAGAAAVLGKLFLVYGVDDRCVDPDEAHYFASSRNTLRRRFMIPRAAVICFSNAGS